MQIPDYYTEFLTRKEIYGYIASLSNNQFCDVTRTCGINPADDEHLRILYMSELSPNLLKNLEINPWISLNGISAYTFESYQLKGKYISHEELNTADIRNKDKYLKGVRELVHEMKFGIDDKSLDNYCLSGATALVMKVEEIYEQTPKAGTGEKIKETTP